MFPNNVAIAVGLFMWANRARAKVQIGNAIGFTFRQHSLELHKTMPYYRHTTGMVNGIDCFSPIKIWYISVNEFRNQAHVIESLEIHERMKYFEEMRLRAYARICLKKEHSINRKQWLLIPVYLILNQAGPHNPI